jgi:hypothetical protein
MGVLKITSADKSGITLQYMLEEDPKEAFRRRMVVVSPGYRPGHSRPSGDSRRLMRC